MFRLRRVGLLLLLLAGVLAAQDVRSLTILHTNDLHARLLPDEDQKGGFAHLATVIRRELEGCSACLLLNGGDFVQGTPVSTLFRGLPVFEFVNRFGYDASTLGNHEFDYGWELIPQYIRAARFPFITANVVDREGRLLAGRPYLLHTVNGVRVAIIGAVMGDLLEHYATPDRMGPWRALPPFETVRRYAAEVRGRSDLIVLLGHLNDGEQDRILHELPEVDVVVTGHNHRGLDAAQKVDGRVLVEVQGYGRELGRLDLQVNVPQKKLVSWTWKKIPVDARTVAAASDIAALVKKWEAKVAKIVDVPIGVAKRDFGQREVKLLIERAMREETGADFAFMNQGGVRDRLPKGRILARHVWNIMPFDNMVVVGTFKGVQLPPVVTAGRQVDPNGEYRLAVSDFTAVNQSAKSQLGTDGLVFPKSGPLLRDLLITWVKRQKVLD